LKRDFAWASLKISDLHGRLMVATSKRDGQEETAPKRIVDAV